MLHYEKFTLSNGLKVLVHQNKNVGIAVFNLLYNVGAKDENEDKTGFAHLFEHLMFGGSVNIPNFDEHLQQVGGECNAFTSNDITNYYITLPAQNLETAFWLESDRMLSLSFDEQVLEVQKNVVIEEFKQRYLNQPYGDVWLKLRPLAYQKHPYRWATIGKDISHIAQATMQDVKDFFFRFYRPNNAILCVAGNVSVDEVERLARKWFEPIEAGEPYQRNLPQEPKQQEARFVEVSAQVPLEALYKAYKMPARLHPDFETADLISDILGRGKSSRLYENLVRKKQIFTDISAYITNSVDEGLLVVQGMVNPEISLSEANQAVESEVQRLLQEGISEKELRKVQNKAFSTYLFAKMEELEVAMNLCFFEMLGDAEKYNRYEQDIFEITPERVQRVAQDILQPNQCSTLFYRIAG
ncbi:MAG: pitrilysin family protein [Raineya sp.]|nr:insulinase family protein [Raineya sp.]MDW8296482.1 pitrilysin family protein [Raineya sp.]